MPLGCPFLVRLGDVFGGNRGDDQSNSFIRSDKVAPASAQRHAAALRRPWAEHCGKPAALHCSRNQLPNPAGVNGLPHDVTR